MKRFGKISVLSTALLSLFLVACGSDSGSSDGTDSSGGGNSDLASECGAVVNGSLQNPVNTSSGQALTAFQVISSNLVGIDTGSGPQLVKLHALGPASANEEDRARSVLSSTLFQGGFFFAAGANCVFNNVDGGVGTVGQVISPSGRSLTEELIKSGYSGEIEQNGACNESLIAPCYTQLKRLADSQQPETFGRVNWFLWKPESEGGFNFGLLSILVDSCNVRVLVNGTELQDFGPSNGRCTTARSTTTDGCGFGSNVRVEVLDSRTGVPYSFADGNPYYIIPNGCNRVEYRL